MNLFYFEICIDGLVFEGRKMLYFIFCIYCFILHGFQKLMALLNGNFEQNHPQGLW